jgi:hypothetical protein
VNANFCMVSSFGVHHDAAVAQARFREGFRFFQFALAWHYQFGVHVPGQTDIWEKFQTALPHMDPDRPAEGGISNPEGLRGYLRKAQEAGVDQVTFVHQAGRTRHDHICEALELCAAEVIGEFKANEAERVARKDEELAPFIEAAFERKRNLGPLADPKIEPIMALGRQIAEKSGTTSTPQRVTWREALRRGEEEQMKKSVTRITG